MENIFISGFSDEIDSDFTKQLNTVKELGMSYISLRSVDGKNISEYSADEAKELIIPRLLEYNIKVSSIGSPIGKIKIDDEADFLKQKNQLETLCEISNLLDCKYIRVFSFYIAEGENPENYKDKVVEKMKEFTSIAKKYDVILIHENEKDIFGDIASRCDYLIQSVNSDNLKAVFDFANFVQVKEDTKKCWEVMKKHTVYIHIKDAVYEDNDNVLCGTGDGNIPTLLKTAIESGYKGFLTLEPHLVLFDSLKDLETKDANEVIKGNKAKDGADGYKMQYNALINILKTI